ncbi:tetratricopeptide repeat protein [Streptomyces chartreusis]|uniref:tetratricopeptide repeat protein n=1 Tax=Streptomyces chartreusis TaxID=1969 RepID=UPI002E7FE011|nr:tetratricopeptide repeat protein [Streptomyces chartreusis]WUB23845.1 tetratricopeptide repeat protein [Streptomyces chartreusis]
MSTDLYGVRVLDVDPQRRLTRLRVFVVYYEPSWGSDDLLPEDPSFFFRVLWEGPYDRSVLGAGAGRELNDLVTQDEYLDEGWVDEHTHRFVANVRRLATRNHPMDETAWNRLSTFYYERDGAWEDEQLLVQGDYEVEVTDSRWLASLRPGDTWGTTSYPTEALPASEKDDRFEAWLAEDAADGDAHAEFVLGWVRHDHGDIPGAIAAYRRVIDIGDADQKAKALLYLGDVHAGQRDWRTARDTYRQLIDEPGVSRLGRRYQARATLSLAVALRELGDASAARETFWRVEQFNDRELSLAARRLAGTETWAELTRRVQMESGPDAARAALAEACGSGAVARFGTALARVDFATARTELATFEGPSELEYAAAFCLDFAVGWMPEDAEWMPEGDEGDVSRVIELAVETGACAEGYRYAVEAGFLAAETGDESISEMVANRLYIQLFDERDTDDVDPEERDLDTVARFAATAETAHPRVATGALGYIAQIEEERGDLQAAAALYRRAAAVTGNDLVTAFAAGAAFQLGRVYGLMGEVEASRAAYIQAERGFPYFETQRLTATKHAEMLEAHGEKAAAVEVWVRAAYHQTRDNLDDEADVAWSVHRLGERLEAAGEPSAARIARDLAGTPARNLDPKVDTFATFQFVDWIVAHDRHELTVALLKPIAESRSIRAGAAALRLGDSCRDSGDVQAARTWWERTLEVGSGKERKEAKRRIGELANA